jgi:hypothetical protein
MTVIKRFFLITIIIAHDLHAETRGTGPFLLRSVFSTILTITMSSSYQKYNQTLPPMNMVIRIIIHVVLRDPFQPPTRMAHVVSPARLSLRSDGT